MNQDKADPIMYRWIESGAEWAQTQAGHYRILRSGDLMRRSGDMNELEKAGWGLWGLAAAVFGAIGFVLLLNHLGWLTAVNTFGDQYIVPVLLWGAGVSFGSLMLYALVMGLWCGLRRLYRKRG